MRRILVVLCVVLSAFAITDVSAWAQATGQISGNVRDQSGAVLPGVEVTATQTDTGISRSTITNETGGYLMPNVVVGPYRLEAALPGFRTGRSRSGQRKSGGNGQCGAGGNAKHGCRTGYRESENSGTALERAAGDRLDHSFRRCGPDGRPKQPEHAWRRVDLHRRRTVDGSRLYPRWSHA